MSDSPQSHTVLMCYMKIQLNTHHTMNSNHLNQVTTNSATTIPIESIQLLIQTVAVSENFQLHYLNRDPFRIFVEFTTLNYILHYNNPNWCVWSPSWTGFYYQIIPRCRYSCLNQHLYRLVPFWCCLLESIVDYHRIWFRLH